MVQEAVFGVGVGEEQLGSANMLAKVCILLAVTNVISAVAIKNSTELEKPKVGDEMSNLISVLYFNKQ